MKKKTWAVTRLQTVWVEAKDEEEAMEIAEQEDNYGQYTYAAEEIQ